MAGTDTDLGQPIIAADYGIEIDPEDRSGRIYANREVSVETTDDSMGEEIVPKVRVKEPFRLWHSLIGKGPSEIGTVSAPMHAYSPKGYVLSYEAPRHWRFHLRRGSVIAPARGGFRRGSQTYNWLNCHQFDIVGPRSLSHDPADIVEVTLTDILSECEGVLKREDYTERLVPRGRVANLRLFTDRTLSQERELYGYAVSKHVAFLVMQPDHIKGSIRMDRAFNSNVDGKGRNKRTVAVKKLDSWVPLRLDFIACDADGFPEPKSRGPENAGWLRKLMGSARFGSDRQNDEAWMSSEATLWRNTGAPVPLISFDRRRWIDLWDRVIQAEEDKQCLLVMLEGSPATEFL